MSLKYAEFCTGIGGFSLGLEKSNLKAELVYSNEMDESCERTFEANFMRKFDSKNIFDINPKELPDFDILCSGFPCQPFSQAGKSLGFEDPRGTVFFKLLDIIKEKNPSILFLENVPNLISHDKGNTFKVIVNELQNNGYNVSYYKLDSKFFGVPQSRPRIYILALNRLKFKNNYIKVTEKISDEVGLRKFINQGDFSIPISPKWEIYVDLYTNKISSRDVPFQLPKTRRKLERIAPDCELDDCIFQIRSSGIRAYSIDRPFPTFAVSNSGGGAMIPVLSKERRHLNITEMKRIMGFPDNFIFPDSVSRTDQIKQLANAVCPPVITSIFNDINLFLSNFQNIN